MDNRLELPSIRVNYTVSNGTNYIVFSPESSLHSTLLTLEMWPSEGDLEPLDSIIDRMNPIAGFPYPMKSAKNDGFPRGKGDPWIGAYTRNGYWFKLSWAGNDEWNEVANEMWFRNEFLVDSKSLDLYRKAMNFGENAENLKLLVAKNIRGDVLGAVLLARNPLARFSTIGALFVQEDFRHVGIGSILTREIKKGQQEVAWNSISYLLHSAPSFETVPREMRQFARIRVKNASGFGSLKEEKTGIELLFGREIDEEKWSRVTEFGESCTNETRNWKAFVEDDEDARCQLIAAFRQETEECVGVSALREIRNEDCHVPDLLVAPLYAKSTTIAEILLRKTLKKHYNPDDDYDFDVDEGAIYRRSVNFFVFSSSESLTLPLLKKLSGSDGGGVVEKDRLSFQTCSDFQLPAVAHDSIFALSDPIIYLS